MPERHLAIHTVGYSFISGLFGSRYRNCGFDRMGYETPSLASHPVRQFSLIAQPIAVCGRSMAAAPARQAAALRSHCRSVVVLRGLPKPRAALSVIVLFSGRPSPDKRMPRPKGSRPSERYIVSVAITLPVEQQRLIAKGTFSVMA